MKHLAIKPLNPPLLVGITGASGAIYGARLLELLRSCNVETHLIVSRAAQMTLAYETSLKLADVERMATVVYSNSDVRNRNGDDGEPDLASGRCCLEGAPPFGPHVAGSPPSHRTHP
jgi:hypothetical protein